MRLQQPVSLFENVFLAELWQKEHKEGTLSENIFFAQNENCEFFLSSQFTKYLKTALKIYEPLLNNDNFTL